MDIGKRCTAEFIGTFWLVFVYRLVFASPAKNAN